MQGFRSAVWFVTRRVHALAGGLRRPWPPGQARGQRSWLARRAGVFVVALAMPPMLAGAGSVSGPAPMPTAAAVRGAVVRLADWMTGKTPPASAVPRQVAGKAPGPQRQVPAAATRAVARARGHAPGKGPGQIPAYVRPAAKVKRYVTGPADPGGQGSFNPATSTLVRSGTTANSKLYRNSDGSYTRLEYPAQAPAGQGAAAATLAFAGPAGVGVKGTHVTSASLRVLQAWNGQCPVSAAVTVRDASGREVGRWSGKPRASACGSGSRGGWISVPVSAASLRALSTARNAGLTVTVTPAPGGKPAQAAVLVVTAATGGTVQVNGQWPPTGYNSPTLTPELMASASDSDGGTLQYDFTLYDASGTTLDSTGWISSDDGQVPQGDLAWGKTYYWTVQAKDGTATSQAPQMFALSTPVPQPLVYSGLGQETIGPAGFDAQNGNFTTQASDVTVPVTGPQLSLQRTYNSLDPLASGAFGTGWTSVLDMTVSPGPGGPGATEVVAYPDGERVAFGLNADGTYKPPQGRYGTLTPMTGGFELVDKADAIYEFTRALGSGVYAVTELNDPMGHALDLTYSSAGQITVMTSRASHRSLHLTWSTPAGASHPHVTSVSTDAVTPGDNSTAITWQYDYSGDQLTAACNESESGQPCTAYAYQSGSDYPAAVLDSGPGSYWRLNEGSGTTAASSVLTSEGTDNASYVNPWLDVTSSPLAGEPTSVGAVGFDGTNAYVKVPQNLGNDGTVRSVSLWFDTDQTGNDVLLSQSADPITASSTTKPYTPVIYVGSDGKLQAGFAGTSTPLSSASAVDNDHWHNAVLTSTGSQETLYIDGVQAATAAETVTPFIEPNTYLGAGFLGGSYPDEANAGNTPAATYYSGAMSDVATWNRPLTAAEVSGLYAAGTGPAALLNSVTRPSGKNFEQASYGDPVTGRVTHVTDANGGSWTPGAPAVTGSSQVYAAAVAGAQPQDYWRLADTGTSAAVNQLNAGTATYNDVTQGVSGGPFADTTADGFDGSSSYLALPDALISPGNQSVSLWFKTTATDGMLLSSSADSIASATTPNAFTPNLYVGQDGDLNGEFFYGDAPISSGKPVNDGKWHNVVLAAGTGSQSLYLDGQLVGAASGTVTGGSSDGEDNVYVGTGFLGGIWADQPHYSTTDPTGYPAFFNGDIAEVAVYPQQLSAADVTAEWAAAKQSQGPAPVETAQVTDPGTHKLTYRYDPLNSARVLSQTDGLGDTTSYGYDSNGFQDSVTDPDGDVTDTGYDVRGNMVSKTTCQDQATGQCSTSYYSYSPNDTTPTLTAPFSANDEVMTASDPRSSSPDDTTYRTTDVYDPQGHLLSSTTPPVPGHPSGRTTTYVYTDGTTTAGSPPDNPVIAPGGLLWKTTSPAGAVTETLYNINGDVAETINADGLTTTYTYDGIGRKTSQTTIYTDNGGKRQLVTTYSYDADGRVTQQVNPTVTDRVTGDNHTPKVTTSYDADGDVLSQVTADTTGGDASRTVSYTYTDQDQKKTSTDPALDVTQYTYDSYGNVKTKTDPAGNETDYVYDPDNRLLTTTLQNYAGGLIGSGGTTLPAGPLTLESRAYDPAGRLSKVTDAMGRATTYGYTDNGLTSAVTRSGPGAAPAGGSSTQELDSYDPAGNLVSKVTNNGATTTSYAVDAAGRVASQTVDPGGLDRVTAYTYDPDDHVATQQVSQGGGTPVQSTSYTYDPMGNKASQTLDDPGAGGPAGWWTLDQSAGTNVPDHSGTGNIATASGVTWSGGMAVLSGQAGQKITTRGPVADTTGSFTVTAWVNMAAKTGDDQDAVSQNAGSMAGFYLGYDSDSGTWGFARPETDTNDPSFAIADSAATAQTGSLVFLAGVYDANTGDMTLYVNGTKAGTANDPTPIASAGPVEIGAGKVDGQANADAWDGSIGNVQVYPSALTSDEIGFLDSMQEGGGDITRDGLVTTWQLDQRGLPTAETNPDRAITYYDYDQAGRLAVTTGARLTTQQPGGAPAVLNPTTSTGYDTFGDVISTEDTYGNETTYTYDPDGRQLSKTLPAYTPPGQSSQVNGTSTQTYDALGQVKQRTDPLGNTTSYNYDQLGDQIKQTDPTAGVTLSSATDGITTATYDADREQLSKAGPTGAVTSASYDYLGRQITATEAERFPSAVYTTLTSYAPTPADTSGTWKSSQTSPDGVITRYGYDAAGETTQVTDGAGNTTGYTFDAAGRQTTTTNPDHTSQTVSYDPAGNKVSQVNLDHSGHTLTTQSASYDGEGDQLSATDALGNTTTFTYDPAGDLTAETQPVTSSAGIITSFGYDANANQTRYTDGNGNQWLTSYTTWNLPEYQTEPSTSDYSSLSDTRSLTVYDGDGDPASVTEPGGVTMAYSYDAMGDLTGQTGSGATAPTAARTFHFDAAGNMLSAATSSTAPAGQPSNATSETFTWDDRRLPLTATGSAGSTTLSWNGDKQQATVNDAAGTTGYQYDNAGRLQTLTDPASGATLTYSYYPTSQLHQVAYGSGADTRTYVYDDLHRLTSDALTTASGAAVASIGYGYNLDGDLTSKTTTGFTAAGSNAYGYDQAGRLTSWTSGSTTTSYGYDGAGNRTQAGNTTYTYDARDELISDGTSKYSYTANGDLSSVTNLSGTVTSTSTSDAYGQQATQGNQSSTYDANDRVVGVTANGATASLSYVGNTGQLASDGTTSYTWTPDGTLTGTRTVGSAGVLDLTDRHTDVVGQFSASATSLPSSRTYGPWGTVIGGTLAGSLGYQSQYTSPATGQTDMGARWYNPSTGSFANKDTVANKPTPNSASASPFGYAADDPLTGTDPTGHNFVCSPTGACYDTAPTTANPAQGVACSPTGACYDTASTAAPKAPATTVAKPAAVPVKTTTANPASHVVCSPTGACYDEPLSTAHPTPSTTCSPTGACYDIGMPATDPAGNQKSQANAGDPLLQISPHVFVQPDLPEASALQLAWQEQQKDYPNSDEYTDWVRICMLHHDLCNEAGFGNAFTVAIGSSSPTEVAWGRGLAMAILPGGVGVANWYNDPVWKYLVSVTQQAIRQWNAAGTNIANFTTKQYVHASERFADYMKFKGTQIHNLINEIIKDDAADGHPLAQNLITAEMKQHAPDVQNMSWPEPEGSAPGYDFTTLKQMPGHQTYPEFGGARLLPWDSVEYEMQAEAGRSGDWGDPVAPGE